MDVTVQIPDDVAGASASMGAISRAASSKRLRSRSTGSAICPRRSCASCSAFTTRDALDGLLKAHDVFEPYGLVDFEREREDLQRLSLRGGAPRHCRCRTTWEAELSIVCAELPH